MHLSTSTFHSNAASNMAFKTSNPNIFPSLNPLGSFYKQHKTIRSPPTQHETQEPAKKQKLNNGREEVVQKSNLNLPVAEVLKKTDERKHNESWLDKDGFSLPKLPKRFNNNTENQVREAIQSSTIKTLEDRLVNVNTESLIMPDNAMKELKNNLMAMDQKDQRRETKPKRAHKKSKTKKQQVMTEINYEAKTQSSEQALLAALYEKCRIDYYVMLLKQNIQQFSLMQETLQKQCYQFSTQNMKMNYGDLKVEDRIHEESMKQEIEC